MTSDGLNTYTYDAENRIKTVNGTGATYYYGGAGLRVKKVTGGTTTRYIFSGTKVIAEYVNGAAVGSPTREYIYSGSTLLATLEGGATKYHHSDHLSERLSTDANGNVAHAYGHYPFGETWYETGTADKWKFTRYEREPESTLDYAIFRYHNSRVGRFQTPDPIAGSIVDPQSLNRYAYVRNDPVNLVDPLGLSYPLWPDEFVLRVYVFAPGYDWFLDWRFRGRGDGGHPLERDPDPTRGPGGGRRQRREEKKEDPCKSVRIDVPQEAVDMQIQQSGVAITSFDISQNGHLTGFSFASNRELNLPGGAVILAGSRVEIRAFNPPYGVTASASGGSISLPTDSRFVSASVSGFIFNNGQFELVAGRVSLLGIIPVPNGGQNNPRSAQRKSDGSTDF